MDFKFDGRVSVDIAYTIPQMRFRLCRGGAC